MRCEHIFGDTDCEELRDPLAASAFVHPKAEGLFGQRRDVTFEGLRAGQLKAGSTAPFSPPERL